MNDFLLIALIVLPIVTGVLIAAVRPLNQSRQTRNALTGASLLLQCVLGVLVFFGGDQSLLLFYLTDKMPIALRSDDLARFFVLFIPVLWTLSGFYSFKYMEHGKEEKRYYTFYMMTLGALMALCLASTLITMYLFFEMVTFLSVALVMQERTREAVAAGVKYLIYSVAGASMGLLGIFYMAPNTSSLFFTPGGSLLPPDQLTMPKEALLAIIFVTLVGFSTKAGMFPMHGWLPTAHPVAPAPASAVLSGVITKAGVLCVLRFIYFSVGPEFFRGTWVQLALLGCATITVFMGSMLALKEKMLKKRLAYSSISQVSYILCGLYLMDPIALEGAMLHIFFHAITKSALFLCAGAIIFYTGRTRVEELHGLGRKMPMLMWFFTICGLGLIGIPPMGGFISKWYLVQGAIASINNQVPVFNWLVPVTLLVSAVLTAAYLLPVAIHAFFDDPESSPAMDLLGSTRPPALMMVPILIYTAAVAVLGIFPNGLIDFFHTLGIQLL